MPVRARRLFRASTDLLKDLDVDRILWALVEAMRDITAADASSVSLVDDEGSHFVLVAAVGLSDAYVRSQRIPVAAARGLYRSPAEHVIVDLTRSPVGDPARFAAEGLATVLAVPVVRDGQMIGALNAYLRDPRASFSEEDIDLAHVLAAQASIAIANARLFADLRREQEDKERFLSIVSHELRTPLTPLKALAQLLRGRIRRARQGTQPLDLESLERNLRTIERQVDRMSGLVSDLLSVSRAGRGVLEIDRRPFDLAQSVRDAVEQYVDATREEGRHRFELEAPATLPVVADEARVEQVLMNLIGNAVKYSPRGGTVRVSLTRADGAAVVTIADEGIGVPAEDLPRLGAAFTLGSGKAATFAGMGIGLHVAKLVAEAHGGALAIESDGEDRGTTVRVTLPA